jgi:2-dehydro-3-deoxy-D-arabinonate dehydratase
MGDLIGQIVRALDIRAGELIVGVGQSDGLAPLSGVGAMSDLLRLGAEDFEARLTRIDEPIPYDRLRILPPIDDATEVWAAGVTYLASREAREEESGDRDVYRRVYDADRPELFSKGPAWRTVTHGEPIGIRDDSPNNVPEPEVGLVLNGQGELVGFTIVDDVSSRSIEGENPLYLPQAKVYDGCCGLGRSIVPVGLIADRAAMEITMTITRDEKPIFTGASSTGRLKRDFDELAGYLFRQMSFPHGAVLATGTSVVPPMTTALEIGDMVEIEITGLGTLANQVFPASEVGSWLVARRLDPGVPFDGRPLVDRRR